MSRLSSAALGLLLVFAALDLDFSAAQVTQNVVKQTVTETIKPNGVVVEKVKTVSFDIVNGVKTPKTVTVSKTVGTGGGSGDPLIRAADGTLFFFDGEPGKFYNLISEPGAYQVSMLLKEANNAVHLQKPKNGTYMQAVGFKQGNVLVEVGTFADDSARMIVNVNGEKMYLQDAAALTESQTIPLDLGGEVNVTFTIFHQHYGTVAHITSPTMEARLSLVPPGLDHAGYWQPSYINVNVSIVSAPQQPLQGVIGDTFHARSASDNAATADSPKASLLPLPINDLIYPVYPDSAYELASLFDEPPFAFSAAFTHDVISQHKLAAGKLLRWS